MNGKAIEAQMLRDQAEDLKRRIENRRKFDAWLETPSLIVLVLLLFGIADGTVPRSSLWSGVTIAAMAVYLWIKMWPHPKPRSIDEFDPREPGPI
jgi:hypothetical protein